MRTKPKIFTPRKLLVAMAGVASVNYVLACEKPYTSGNLMAPPSAPDAEPPAIPPTSGNLMAPPPDELASPVDAGAAAPKDAGLTAKDAGATAKDAGAAKGVGTAKDAGAPKDTDRPVAPIVPRRPPTSGNLMAPPGSGRQ